MAATPTTPDSTPLSVVAAKEEQAFVEGFSKKIETGEIPQDRGRAKAERQASETVEPPKPKSGKPASDDDADTQEEDTSEGEGTRSEPDSASDDDAEEAAEDVDNPSGTDDDSAEDPGDDQGDATEEADEPESELAKQAAAELAKHGVKLTLDDLPKEARPLVEQKLKLMQAGFTRAMQEARAYRDEEAQFRAERDFDSKHPELRIVELLQKGGAELEAKVNELLDGATTDVGKKALEVTTREARSEALKGINAQAQKTQQLLDRADVITNYAKTACTKLNIPFDLVEELVASRLLEKPADARDLTEAELDGIIGKVQRSFAKRGVDQKRMQRKDAIQGRQRDKKVTSPAARSIPGTGTPSPAGEKPPQNDEEFVARMSAKLGGARR